ncbi:MAG: PfkB family carbohydrate kinase [Capsulimonadales bacterium]|nr:PfkB family carbohydrate kinase [Capsulimonadales bacterium]
MILTFSPNPTLERVALVEQFRTGQTQKPMRVATWAGGGGLREANVIRLLGGDPLALGFVGGRLGDLLIEALERQQVPHALTPVVASTRGSFITIDKERGFISELPDPPPEFTEAEAAKLLSSLDERLPDADLLVMSDAEEGNAASLFGEAIGRAKAAGVPIIADLSGDALDLAVRLGVYVIQVSIKTLQKQTERSLAHDSAIVQEAQAVRAQGVDNVLVTLGDEGALLIGPDGAFRLQPPVVSHFNPVGSGETLSAAFAVRLLQTRDVVDAARFGCAAASVNVTHDEPGYATPGEVGVLYPRTTATPIVIR